MKTLKQIQYLFVAVLAMAMAACADNSPEEVFVPVELEGQGVYFAKATKLNYEVEGTEGSIDFKVYRTETSGPATVNVYSTTETTLFTIPETISFESGAAETTLTVSYANIVRGLKYDFNVGFEEGTDYGNSELNFTLLYPAEVIEEWEVISEKAILTDNLYSMFGVKNLTGEDVSSLKNIVVEKEKNSEKYRFKSPYNNEYWMWMLGATLPEDFELPYIVIDGEYFKEKYPDNPASEGAYMIPSVALGLIIASDVSYYFDAEETNFGTVAGNLSVSGVPVGPDHATYPAGKYDKKTKTFDFGATYHWLSDFSFQIIGAGSFLLSLDPALLETNYERDYTWEPVEDATGYFTSELEGESWMNEVMQAVEDPTFFKLVSPYVDGYHLYFFYDEETGKVKIPELQKSGYLCMDGENNMIYMDGKAEVSEDKEFIFTLNFYHYNVKTENRYDLVTYEESFLWGRGPLDLFEKGLTIDDYQGYFVADIYKNGSVAGNMLVTLKKANDKYILAKGLSVEGALQHDYDDTVALEYDEETGLLVFRAQYAADYTDEYGTFPAMAVPFNSAEGKLTTAETFTGGFMPDGTFQFINTPGNTGTWDGIIFLYIDGGYYMMNGYYSGLVWTPYQPSQKMSKINAPYATREQIQEWVAEPSITDQWEKAAAPGKQNANKQFNGTQSNLTR